MHQKAIRRTGLAAIVTSAVLLSACRPPPPGAMDPVVPQSARAEDTTAVELPAPSSEGYCEAAQQILASTTLKGQNTVFTDMQEYRHSKSAAHPHLIYQVVTYVGDLPVVVSCKVKTAAHLRGVYGPDAAGTQHRCVEVTRRAQAEAVKALEAAGQPDAARQAAALVLDDNEPYVTGQAYLGDFELSYVDSGGAVHLNTPSLFQNYDSWVTRFLPWQFQGQQYCHLATTDYIKALATGIMQPGTVITTGKNASVTPGAAE